jgi:hypothetical protein
MPHHCYLFRWIAPSRTCSVSPLISTPSSRGEWSNVGQFFFFSHISQHNRPILFFFTFLCISHLKVPPIFFI